MRKRTERLLAASGMEPKPLIERSIEGKGPRPNGKMADRYKHNTAAVVAPDDDLPMWWTLKVYGHPKPSDNFADVDLAKQEWIDYREAAWKRQREMVPRMIPQLLRKYWGFDPMPFHVNFLQEMFKGGKIVRCWPTDHAKSIMSSFFFPILSLMNDPNESHIILGANQNDSKRRLAAIQMELDSNHKLIEDWPWIAKPKSKDNRQWSRQAMNVVGRTVNKPNPSIYVSAIGAADIRGRRGKLIVDDAEGNKHRESVTERQKLYDFVKLEAIRNFEDANESPRPLLCLVGTPFDPDSIYIRLKEEGWNVEMLPYRYPQGHRKANHLIWPAKADKIAELRRMLTPAQFAIAMEMDPTAGNKSMLSFEQIRDLATGAQGIGSGEGLDAVVVSIDPASGSTNRRADYAGVTRFRISWAKEDDLPTLDLLAARKCEDELWDQVLLVQQWTEGGRLPAILEGNSQQWGSYRSVFRNIAPEVQLIRHQTTEQNKTDTKLGITVIKTMLKQGRLRIDPELMEDESVQTLMREIRDLGMQGAHDHLCASLWFGVWWAYKARKRLRGPELTGGFAPRLASAYSSYRPRFAAYRRY